MIKHKNKIIFITILMAIFFLQLQFLISFNKVSATSTEDCINQAYENISNGIIDGIINGNNDIIIDISSANLKVDYNMWNLKEEIRRRMPWLVFQFDERQIGTIDDASGNYSKQIVIKCGNYSIMAKSQLSTRMQKELLSFMDCVEPTMSEIEIVTALYDRYLSKVGYSYDGMSYGASTMVQSALLSQSAKCYEYDIILATLMNMYGIKAYCIPDTYKKAESVTNSHAWTMVVLNGKNYMIDGTWDGRGLTYGKMHHSYFISNQLSIANSHSTYFKVEDAINAYKLNDSTEFDNMIVTNQDYYYHYYNGYWYFVKNGNQLYRTLWSDNTKTNPVVEELVTTLPYKSSAVIETYNSLAHAFNRDRLYYFNFDNSSIESISLKNINDKATHVTNINGWPKAIQIYEDELMYKFGINTEQVTVKLDEKYCTSFEDREYDNYSKSMLKGLISASSMMYDYFGYNGGINEFPESARQPFKEAINNANLVYENNGTQSEINSAYKLLQSEYSTYKRKQISSGKPKQLELAPNVTDFGTRGDVGQFSALNNEKVSAIEMVLYSKNSSGKLELEMPTQLMVLDNNDMTYQSLYFTQYLAENKTYVLKYRAIGDGVYYTDSEWQTRELQIGSVDNPANNTDNTAFAGLYNDWICNEYTMKSSFGTTDYGFRKKVSGVNNINIENNILTFDKVSLDNEFNDLKRYNWAQQYINGTNTKYIDKLLLQKDDINYRIKVYKDNELLDLIITDDNTFDISSYITQYGNYKFGVTVIPPLLYTTQQMYDDKFPTRNGTTFLNSTEILSDTVVNETPLPGEMDIPTQVNFLNKVLTWEGNASSYILQLYKNNAKYGSEIITNNNSYDFTSSINEVGEYKVSIYAKGHDGYLDSEKALSNIYEYKIYATKPLLIIPSVENITFNSITLTPPESLDNFVVKYKINNGEWQQSNVFENLEENTEYNFVCKYFSTANYYVDSVESESIKICTNKRELSKLEMGKVELNGNSLVSFAKVNNAVGYKILVYKDGELFGDILTVESDVLSVDIRDYTKDVGSIYYVEVIAIGDGVNYNNSNVVRSNEIKNTSNTSMCTGGAIVSQNACAITLTVGVAVLIYLFIKNKKRI